MSTGAFRDAIVGHPLLRIGEEIREGQNTHKYAARQRQRGKVCYGTLWMSMCKRMQ
jgi:hypothetical protein